MSIDTAMVVTTTLTSTQSSTLERETDSAVDSVNKMLRKALIELDNNDTKPADIPTRRVIDVTVSYVYEGRINRA